MEARFEWRQALGKGGFGVVYEAYDRERHARVALKLLKQPDPANLYRLKHEFRTLADLSHPNLVSLYELVADEEPSFIAMELVDGMDFITYVSTPRPEDFGLTEKDGFAAPDAETGLVDPPSHPIAPPPQQQEWACHIGRLLASLSQLTDALIYLHGAGRLHRDIKPSNVLVRPDGFVKVLDFGLATEFSAEAPAESHAVAGTPAYMSPEQAMTRPLTAATDWYSVGVMLFKSLTGHLPFAGTYLEMKRAKQLRDGPAPTKLVPTIPPGLDELCRDLLKLEPDDRPSGADIRVRLDRLMARESVSRSVGAPVPAGVFVGRQEQLHALADAVEATKSGHAALVYVHGSSGMGKTSLVRRFLQNLRIGHANAVILAGRCYERESVAYKALDGIVDELTQYLRTLSRPDVEALLPRDVAALARLFPAFRRLEAVTHGQYRDADIRDSQELRRRGFAAFRDLLARLADRQVTALFIDDLQWGDADSTALLIDLFRAPDPPPLLLVAAYRSEEAETNAVLRLLPGHDTPAAPDCKLWDLDVRELSESQARELATTLMATHGRSERAEAIVRESGRSPFFIDELVRYAAAGGTTTGGVETGGELTLETVIRGRADRLAPSARRLLEVLAVSGQPLKSRLASRAAELGAFEIEAMTTLRAAHLTRARVTEAGEAVEVYHDRIRQTIVKQLPADELRAWHARLAAIFEGEPGTDPETLVIHYQGAGEPQRAAGYAVAAADRAREALAFDRAARLYRVALDLGALDASTRQQVSVHLGDALAAAGRGRDASLAYLAAAERTTAASALELRRRAAEQLLRSGHIQEGYRVVRVVLEAMQMRLAHSPQRALLSLVFRRAQLWFRGLTFVPRDESQIPAETLVRVDACWSLASALGVVDTIRGADFQCRHLLLSLDTGDRYRIARAIAIESAYVATSGESARPRQERLSMMAAELAEQVGHPHALALVVLARGISALLQGRWTTARAHLEQAETLLSERCTGVAWELDAGRLYHLITLFNLGDLVELSKRLPKLIAEARERDDIMAVTSLRTRIGYLPHLFADDAAKAREEVHQGMAQWAGEGFHAQHSWELFARGEIDLYDGRGHDAWSYVSKQWPALRRSLLLRIQGTRIELGYLRARAAVSAAAESGGALTGADRAARLRDAAKDAKRLARESAPWAGATAAIIRAGIAATRHEGDRGLADLLKAEAAFRAADMPLHATVASRCRGLLDRGPVGQRLVEDADRWMEARGIRSPAGMTAMLAPGTFS